MQLEKAKETKQDMERCRLLAQRIAEELAPATAAVLNAETPALEKALHRAGVDANPFTVAARQADLLVVEDPAWVEMPAQLPGQVLLVFTGSNVAEGWAEELARRGYYRGFPLAQPGPCPAVGSVLHGPACHRRDDRGL